MFILDSDFHVGSCAGNISHRVFEVTFVDFIQIFAAYGFIAFGIEKKRFGLFELLQAGAEKRIMSPAVLCFENQSR